VNYQIVNPNMSVYRVIRRLLTANALEPVLFLRLSMIQINGNELEAEVVDEVSSSSSSSSSFGHAFPKVDAQENFEIPLPSRPPAQEDDKSSQHGDRLSRLDAYDDFEIQRTSRSRGKEDDKCAKRMWYKNASIVIPGIKRYYRPKDSMTRDGIQPTTGERVERVNSHPSSINIQASQDAENDNFHDDEGVSSMSTPGFSASRLSQSMFSSSVFSDRSDNINVDLSLGGISEL